MTKKPKTKLNYYQFDRIYYPNMRAVRRYLKMNNIIPFRKKNPIQRYPDYYKVKMCSSHLFNLTSYRKEYPKRGVIKVYGKLKRR